MLMMFDNFDTKWFRQKQRQWQRQSDGTQVDQIWYSDLSFLSYDDHHTIFVTWQHSQFLRCFYTGSEIWHSWPECDWQIVGQLNSTVANIQVGKQDMFTVFFTCNCAWIEPGNPCMYDACKAVPIFCPDSDPITIPLWQREEGFSEEWIIFC